MDLEFTFVYLDGIFILAVIKKIFKKCLSYIEQEARNFFKEILIYLLSIKGIGPLPNKLKSITILLLPIHQKKSGIF